MLFKGVGSKSLTKSSKCDMPHFRRVGKSLVLAKVLRYFPLVLQLRCLYNTPILASFMTWHWVGRSSDGLVCHVVDSLQYKWIDKELGDFGKENRNVRLGLATNAMNLYGVMRSSWSTWFVCLLNYNVLSWLTTKKHVIMFSIIILRKESVTLEAFDVYLHLLVEELYTRTIGCLK
jgi:hypothetical protein